MNSLSIQIKTTNAEKFAKMAIVLFFMLLLAFFALKSRTCIPVHRTAPAVIEWTSDSSWVKGGWQ